MDTTSAFPTCTDNGITFPEPGMMLRDYFAAAALPSAYKYCMEDYYHPDCEDAEYRRSSPRTSLEDNQESIAELAYVMADAMLKARYA